MDNKNDSAFKKISNTVPIKQNKEIKSFIKQLKNKEKYFFDIPEEYRLHPAIVIAERKLGIRESTKRGYDIIKNSFFVEELVLNKAWNDEIEEKNIITYFADFFAYYEFLQGDIYENACYYKYVFSQDIINKYSIDISKINFRSFVDRNIDDFTLEFSDAEMRRYSEAERDKIALKKWVIKFNNCQTYDKFKQITINLRRSVFSGYLDFFIYNFIYSDNENKFKIITQYLNNNNLFKFEKVLCLIFNPYEVLDAYDNSKFYSSSTSQKWKNRLKSFVENLKNDEVEFVVGSCFDECTHYFVWYKIGKLRNCKNDYAPILVKTYRFFESFEEFANFLGNDLSNCDLSQAILPDLNITKYLINDNTKLPIQYQSNITYALRKYYDRRKKCFTVEQTWTNGYGKVIKLYNHKFDYFFDFVYFLKNDLTDSDLLFCDGLKNVSDFSDLNLKNAVLKSDILDKLNINYKVVSKAVEYFDESKSNEIETVNVLTAEREELSFEETLKFQKIYYVTDLHLLHRLHNADCKTNNDELYVLQTVIDSLLKDVEFGGNNVILIGGDTSSDFKYFELFIKLLRTSIDEDNHDVKVIFTLGNHELWSFAGKDFKDYGGTKFDQTMGMEFDEIVEKYRKVISDNNMYLLQNNLIFKYDWNNIEEISTEELKNLSKTELLNRTSRARLILFGGLGFAGYNEKFNANQFIYKFAINREQEIEESKKFERLYEKICDNLSDRRVVIFTHMPQKDWCSNNVQIKGFVYVSGHTHRNYFYDDGDYRIYADNQIGYYQNSCRLKYFYLEDDYDLFATYENGIYEIKREEYIDFNLGKHIHINFSRKFDKLYMLKKNGYYMFILQALNDNLYILNGGAIKRLAYKTVGYYYENMDKVISYIKTPLDNFSNYQKQIANGIKSIGGSGNIHGAIIDIDFFNHIYVNPIDLTVTAYWARDIINKVIYDNIPALLQRNCPDIYSNYLKSVKDESETSFVLKRPLTVKPVQLYLDTDIYRASRQIKKMQKLNSNILGIWIEPKSKKLKDSID